MNFKLDDIIQLITKIGYTYFIIENKSDSRTYKLSSIKNKIDGGLYYLAKEYITEATTIKNSIIITDTEEKINDSNIYIKVENPQLVHYKIAAEFETKIKPGVHPSAIISKEAKIDATAYIGPFSVIGNCIIEANVVLLSHVIVNDNVVIKKNTIIEGSTVIGARGMAWIWDEKGERVMQPQLGGVIIEKNCIIGTNITIVRGSLSENTIIGEGAIMAHGTKIGHGCLVGKQVHFANSVILAGNVKVGDRVFLGSSSVVSSNVTIDEGCIIGAGTVMYKSIPGKYNTIAGAPPRIIKNNNFESKPNGAPKPFNK